MLSDKTVISLESTTPFGILEDGTQIGLYTLRTKELELCATNFGGRIVSLKMLDSNRNASNMILGFETLADYVADDQYMGAIVGRYANRIANARLQLGRTYSLYPNDDPHSIHGGRRGFDRQVWHAQCVPGALSLGYLSEAGEEGYPGSLACVVRYSLMRNELHIDYEAKATAETVINLISHMYFNLTGDARRTILDHQVQINGESFTPVNKSLIPTGELRSVIGTPFDFRRPQAIGARIDMPHSQLGFGQGYDHNWVLDGQPGALKLAARAFEPQSGRSLEVLTTEPGLQFYTGNHLGKSSQRAHANHARRCGFCFETQHFPDSPNHPKFPSTTLFPGQRYRSRTVYRFSVDN